MHIKYWSCVGLIYGPVGLLACRGWTGLDWCLEWYFLNQHYWFSYFRYWPWCCWVPPNRYLEVALLQSSALYISPLQIPGSGPSPLQCSVYIPLTDTWKWPFSTPVLRIYPPYRYLELALLHSSALYISPYLFCDKCRVKVKVKVQFTLYQATKGPEVD